MSLYSRPSGVVDVAMLSDVDLTTIELATEVVDDE